VRSDSSSSPLGRIARPNEKAEQGARANVRDCHASW
jgi:hypothetical protein